MGRDGSAHSRFCARTTDTSDEQVLADLTQVVRDTVAADELELGVAAAAASPSSSTSASRCGSTLTHVSCERSLQFITTRSTPWRAVARCSSPPPWSRSMASLICGDDGAGIPDEVKERILTRSLRRRGAAGRGSASP